MSIKELINEDKIQERIGEIAKQIESDFPNEEIVFLVILKGAIFFSVDLAKKVSNSVIIECIRASSYSGTNSTGNVSLETDLKYDITDKNVIIVEDIVDTGRTLTHLKKYLESNNPKSLKICSLLDKPSRREFELNVDYVGFQIPNEFVVGYGLDYDEKYRNLPYIGILEQ